MAAVAHFQGARDTLGSLRIRSRIAHSVYAGVVFLACLGLGPVERLSLTWIAPKECPQAAAVRAALDQLLPEHSADVGLVEAVAHVDRVHDRYRLKLRLQVGSHRAQRTLESSRCEELTSTGAWLIAVAIDPAVAHPSNTVVAAAEVGEHAGRDGSGSATAQDGARVAPQEPSEPGPSAAQPSPSEQRGEPAREPSRSPARAERRSRERRLAGLLGISFGTAGAAQAELGGAGGLGVGWLYSELALSVLLPRREELAAGAMVRSWSLELGLRECVLWGTRLRWGPCLTLDGLRTVGHAEGLSATEPDQALFWAVAGLGLRAAWHVQGSLELTLAGGAGLPISPRPHFTVEGVGDVAPVSALSGYLRIGIGMLAR